jgi:hypothetical protein
MCRIPAVPMWLHCSHPILCLPAASAAVRQATVAWLHSPLTPGCICAWGYGEVVARTGRSHAPLLNSWGAPGTHRHVALLCSRAFYSYGRDMLAATMGVGTGVLVT